MINRNFYRKFGPLVVLASLLLTPRFALQAQEVVRPETPIYASWKLMDENTKRHFLAGYLYGFRDARALGEIAVEYVKSNPADMIPGLINLLQHYQLTHLAPGELVPMLNEHFKELKNQEDSLRMAIGKLKLR